MKADGPSVMVNGKNERQIWVLDFAVKYSFQIIISQLSLLVSAKIASFLVYPRNTASLTKS